MMTRLFYYLLLIGVACGLGSTARANDLALSQGSSAVVLAYHNVGNDAFAGLNLRKDQFEDHITEIVNIPSSPCRSCSANTTQARLSRRRPSQSRWRVRINPRLRTPCRC